MSLNKENTKLFVIRNYSLLSNHYEVINIINDNQEQENDTIDLEIACLPAYVCILSIIF